MTPEQVAEVFGGLITLVFIVAGFDIGVALLTRGEREMGRGFDD